jgi:hypothetical protein
VIREVHYRLNRVSDGSAPVSVLIEQEPQRLGFRQPAYPRRLPLAPLQEDELADQRRIGSDGRAHVGNGHPDLAVISSDAYSMRKRFDHGGAAVHERRLVAEHCRAQAVSEG